MGCFVYYQQQFTNFSVNASVGASINDYTGNGTGFDSYPGIPPCAQRIYYAELLSMQGSLTDWKTHTKPECVLHRSDWLQRSDFVT